MVKSTETREPSPSDDAGIVALEYPVQLSKVQAPPLRDDTLARERLLDWLSVKIHSRVALLVAEAGYGKTTLLADFSRRTRIRVLWFRLDRGDRDWLGFIAHLIAAVRVHMPAFGTATARILRDASTSMPSLDSVLDVFLRELASLPNDPTALVFDDVHFVDDAPDVRQILRELLARAPERMSFVFASRREPPIRLARLRALGEVAELDTDDLRFDASETSRLFSETYEMPLEASVLAELNRRTEGWAASLQLVRAAIHDRNPSQVRSFISSLSGAEGHLYEYLAEEVIGDLPEDLQQFLMRTSVLDTVDPTLGSVAAGVSEADAGRHIEDAERHGLLARRGTGARNAARAHPLVREFLRARLNVVLGPSAARTIHLQVAMAATDPREWHLAARHYVAAGETAGAHRILEDAIGVILATGAYTAAQEIAASLKSHDEDAAASLVLRSRIALKHAAVDEALGLAERASQLAPTEPTVLITLVAARSMAGRVAAALDGARQLGEVGNAEFLQLARTFEAMIEASLEGSVPAAEQAIKDLIRTAREQGANHYLGVALHNLALTNIARGNFEESLSNSEMAVADLEVTSAGVELRAARVANAMAHLFLGDLEIARVEFNRIVATAPPGQRLELAGDIGEVEALVGESSAAWPLVNGVAHEIESSERGEEARLSRALLHLHDGDLALARRDVGEFCHGRATNSTAFEAKRYLVEGLLVGLEGGGSSAATTTGTALAETQGARFWGFFGRTLGALVEAGTDPSTAVSNCLAEMPSAVSSLAEIIVERLSDLSVDTFELVLREAEARPWRWRKPIRRRLPSAAGLQLQRLADALARIGEREDIDRLHEAGRRGRDRATSRAAFALARRLAPRVFVEDLGRVTILVGNRTVDGSNVRRKVLALLCLLLSKSDFSATRDEVIDSLWPDHDPASALNSLNQTVYFLRRVFEPGFRDEISPGYVGQDGETIWLDAGLVDCRSRRCLDVIRAMPGDPTPDGAVTLATEYRGRFALDFAYEEWAAPYRDALHAGYLRIVERAVRLDLDGGHVGRGTFVAQRAAEVDPDSEDIQVALIRLYRQSGAHAAAAEQYAHYARLMREMGAEPTELAEL